MMNGSPRVAFTTNFCPHYRVRTFETLAREQDVEFFFFSEGSEWYWRREHGVHGGDFRNVYLPGFDVAGTRVSPLLPIKLWRGRYDVYVKCIDGRIALLSAYVVARLLRRPFVLWTGLWARVQSRFHKFFFPITRYIYLHADAIVAYGEHVKRYLISEGIAAEKIFVAPHAVDNDAYRPAVSDAEKSELRAELGINVRAQVVLYLGRLEEAKGLAYLVEAFAGIEDSACVLVIAGSGPFLTRLRELAKTLHIAERVFFPGYIPPADAVKYYSIATVFVLPSITTDRFKEPWGLVVNEAFNQGVPVIASDAVGAAAGGLLIDGQNGFIVPERDAAALANALQRILSNSSLRGRLSAAAVRDVSKWDNARMVRGFVDAIAFVSRSAP